jgi:hypothetical protein
MWIRKDAAFEPIVSPDLYFAAQAVLRARAYHFSNDELLERLGTLYKDRGFLSGLIIDETEGMPTTAVYALRFGSLVRAYRMVGYCPVRDYRYLETNKFLRQLHPEIISKIKSEIVNLGGFVQHDAVTDLLRINDEFNVSTVLARCQTLQSGNHRWKVRFDSSLAPDITVAVRLSTTNQSVLDYYLLPSLDFGNFRINLAERNPVEFESYRFDDLKYLYGMTECTRIRRAA